MIYPLFFPRFRCRAGLCRHTCCAKWEICIDDDAAGRYRLLPGELGEALRQNTAQTEDGAQFILTPEGNCPFLNTDGLCRLIKDSSEDLLCEICREHPRFYGEVNGKTCAGLGLSCEAAAALVLQDQPLRFADGYTGRIYDFGALGAALGVALPRQARLFKPVSDPLRLRKLREALLATEPIDEDWPPSVEACFSSAPGRYAAAAELARTESRRVQRLYEYVFYRRLPDAPVYGVHAAARFSRMSVTYILLEAARTGDLAESARRWSEQIEYSDVNTELLLRTL